MPVFSFFLLHMEHLQSLGDLECHLCPHFSSWHPCWPADQTPQAVLGCPLDITALGSSPSSPLCS